MRELTAGAVVVAFGLIGGVFTVVLRDAASGTEINRVTVETDAQRAAVVEVIRGLRAAVEAPKPTPATVTPTTTAAAPQAPAELAHDLTPDEMVAAYGKLPSSFSTSAFLANHALRVKSGLEKLTWSAGALEEMHIARALGNLWGVEAIQGGLNAAFGKAVQKARAEKIGRDAVVRLEVKPLLHHPGEPMADLAFVPDGGEFRVLGGDEYEKSIAEAASEAPVAPVAETIASAQVPPVPTETPTERAAAVAARVFAKVGEILHNAPNIGPAVVKPEQAPARVDYHTIKPATPDVPEPAYKPHVTAKDGGWPRTIVLVTVSMNKVWDGKPYAADLGKRAGVIEQKQARAAIWLNEGDEADFEKAQAEAKRKNEQSIRESETTHMEPEQTSVVTFPTSEEDPIGRAKREALAVPFKPTPRSVPEQKTPAFKGPVAGLVESAKAVVTTHIPEMDGRMYGRKYVKIAIRGKNGDRVYQSIEHELRDEILRAKAGRVVYSNKEPLNAESSPEEFSVKMAADLNDSDRSYAAWKKIHESDSTERHAVMELAKRIVRFLESKGIPTVSESSNAHEMWAVFPYGGGQVLGHFRGADKQDAISAYYASEAKAKREPVGGALDATESDEIQAAEFESPQAATQSAPASNDNDEREAIRQALRDLGLKDVQ